MRYLVFVFLVFFAGCSQKGETKYYIPTVKTEKTANQKSVQIVVDTPLYLSTDKIWYKKEGVLLPYKNSYLAKNHKEFLYEVLFQTAFNPAISTVSVKPLDSYQEYDETGSVYVLKVSIEVAGKNREKTVTTETFRSQRLGIGAKEGVRGLEECYAALAASAVFR